MGFLTKILASVFYSIQENVRLCYVIAAYGGVCSMMGVAVWEAILCGTKERKNTETWVNV
jgi:membrane-bound lytic murein transglycosylase MltF